MGFPQLVKNVCKSKPSKYVQCEVDTLRLLEEKRILTEFTAENLTSAHHHSVLSGGASL